MLYLKRLLNVFLFLFKLFSKIIFYCLVVLMLFTQIAACLVGVVVMIPLQIIELITVPFIYYMITGNGYYKKYLPIGYAFADFITYAKFDFHVDKQYTFVEESFYNKLFGRIQGIKPLTYLKFEENV